MEYTIDFLIRQLENGGLELYPYQKKTIQTIWNRVLSKDYILIPRTGNEFSRVLKELGLLKEKEQEVYEASIIKYKYQTLLSYRIKAVLQGEQFHVGQVIGQWLIKRNNEKNIFTEGNYIRLFNLAHCDFFGSTDKIENNPKIIHWGTRKEFDINTRTNYNLYIYLSEY